MTARNRERAREWLGPFRCALREVHDGTCECNIKSLAALLREVEEDVVAPVQRRAETAAARERDEARAERDAVQDMADQRLQMLQYSDREVERLRADLDTVLAQRNALTLELLAENERHAACRAEVLRLREPAHDPATCRVCQEHRRREADAVRRKGDQP